MAGFGIRMRHASMIVSSWALAVLSVAAVGMDRAEAEPADTARIVSIGGDVTEILYKIGLEDRIVAVDTTSTFPAEALKQKKSVGYMRALSTEGVLSMNPTLILATAAAGPPEVVAALKRSTVRYVEVWGDLSATGIADKIKLIADVVGQKDKGEAVSKEMTAYFRVLEEARSKYEKPVRALFVMGVQSGRAMIGGAGTSADAILRLAGAENVASTVKGFKPLSAESAISMAPEYIVTMRSSRGDNASAIASAPGLSATPAAKNGRIVVFDGSYLLQFGPRAAQAALDLMAAIHPSTGQ
jgi:heme transport system substrate-binding protein